MRDVETLQMEEAHVAGVFFSLRANSVKVAFFNAEFENLPQRLALNLLYDSFAQTLYIQ